LVFPFVLECLTIVLIAGDILIVYPTLCTRTNRFKNSFLPWMSSKLGHSSVWCLFRHYAVSLCVWLLCARIIV